MFSIDTFCNKYIHFQTYLPDCSNFFRLQWKFGEYESKIIIAHALVYRNVTLNSHEKWVVNSKQKTYKNYRMLNEYSTIAGL